MSKHAKEFSEALHKLDEKFKSMQDVHYEKNKIDFVYNCVEKAMQDSSHFEVLVERLTVLE